MPAQLVALNDGPSILVDKPILLLGRHPECDIQIDSRKVSRRHCCIAQVNDYLVVRDLDSTNGIRINGVRVMEGILRAGDELTIGSHRYRISWDEAPRPGQRPPEPPGTARQPFAMPMAVAAEPDEDDLLEACDEPIALPDPDPVPPGPPRPPGLRAPEEPSFMLPDNLELLPGSGSISGHGGTGPQ